LVLDQNKRIPNNSNWKSIQNYYFTKNNRGINKEKLTLILLILEKHCTTTSGSNVQTPNSIRNYWRWPTNTTNFYWRKSLGWSVFSQETRFFYRRYKAPALPKVIVKEINWPRWTYNIKEPWLIQLFWLLRCLYQFRQTSYCWRSKIGLTEWNEDLNNLNIQFETGKITRDDFLSGIQNISQW
jgi:hypothetical protein